MEKIDPDTVFKLLSVIHPDIIGCRWERHDSLDAAESYGNLYIICPSGEEMETGEFLRNTLTRDTMESLEHTLYNTGTPAFKAPVSKFCEGSETGCNSAGVVGMKCVKCGKTLSFEGNGPPPLIITQR